MGALPSPVRRNHHGTLLPRDVSERETYARLSDLLGQDVYVSVICFEGRPFTATPVPNPMLLLNLRVSSQDGRQWQLRIPLGSIRLTEIDADHPADHAWADADHLHPEPDGLDSR